MMLRGCWHRFLQCERLQPHALAASFGWPPWSQWQKRFQSEVCSSTWQVSSLGRVKTLQGIVHHGCLCSQGYCRAGIQGKNYYVHRLVARAFHGPPPTAEHTQVNHLDGDPCNNRADNLEYATPSENSMHACAMGIRRTGRSGKQIRYRRVGVVQWSSLPSQAEAARALGLHQSAVSRCCRGLQQRTKGGFEFKFVEHALFMGELWQAARYPGITQAISKWQVSSFGRVKTDSGRITFGSLNKAGYFVMRRRVHPDGLCTAFQVHRLVAATFLGQPSTAELQVNHLDGHRSNNRLDNLEYATRAENIQHAYARAGQIIQRPNRGKPVLVREAGADTWVNFESMGAAAAHTDIHRHQIAKICRGERRAPETGSSNLVLTCNCQTSSGAASSLIGPYPRLRPRKRCLACADGGFPTLPTRVGQHGYWTARPLQMET